MSCPFFFPDAPLSSTQEARPVPLGELYRGECRAKVGARATEETELRAWCNFGYGRGACPHFPLDAKLDSVRLMVASDDGETLSIRYCTERDHLPLEHGLLLFRIAEARFNPPHPDDVVTRLAEAYVEAYRRYKEKRGDEWKAGARVAVGNDRVSAAK